MTTNRDKTGQEADAIDARSAVDAWQVAGIKVAIASLDRGEGISHDDVKTWAASLTDRRSVRDPNI